MKVRVLTGAAMTAVLLPVFIFSEYIVFPIVMGLLSVMAVFEMLRVLGLIKNPLVYIPSFLVAGAGPIGAYFAEGLDGGQSDYILILTLAFALYVLYLFAISVIGKGKIAFAKISGVFTTVLYITFSFTAFTLLRYAESGVYLFIIVFISSSVCDIFAYFTGMLFGKHKLIPEISPKKTVEGAVGGTLFAVFGLLLYVFILDKAVSGIEVNYILASVYGLVLAIVGQFGDLVASLIKREHGIKDYGKLLPGHGGVLDRVDSILPISLVLYILTLVFPPIL